MSDDETYKSENNSFKDELDGALLAEEQRKREDEQQRIEAEQRRIEEEQRRKESEQQRIAYLENEYSYSVIQSIKTEIKEKIQKSQYENKHGVKKVEGSLSVHMGCHFVKKFLKWGYYEIDIGIIKMINAVKKLAEREGIVIKSCYFLSEESRYSKLKLPNKLKNVTDNLKIRRSQVTYWYSNDDDLGSNIPIDSFYHLNFDYSIKF